MTLKLMKLNNIVAFMLLCCVFYILVRHLKSMEPKEYLPGRLKKYLIFEPGWKAGGNPLLLHELYDILDNKSLNHHVLNLETFSPVNFQTTILVINVAEDAERLQYLIISLAQVQYIDTVLVVFSHSFYDEKIDNLVRSIDFCKVLQLYYPNSVQLYPNSFPGMDLSDCSNPKLKLKDRRYCAYRDGSVAEVKHHWWWTARYVFEETPWASIHNGMVIFLKEDSIVLPDFLHMLNYAQRSFLYIPEAEIVSFGALPAPGLDHDKLLVDIWRPLYENGFGFKKTTWKKILDRIMHYCEYNDASWSYSLFNVFSKWPKGRMLTVATIAPRILTTSVFRSGQQAFLTLHPLLQNTTLFPTNVQTVVLFSREGMVFKSFSYPPQGNGGWSDYRDHSLCYEPLQSAPTDDDSTTTTTISSA